MKNITFVTGSMSRGGAERVISVLCNYLVCSGYNVSILMLLHSHNEYPLDSRIQVIDLSDDSRKLALYLPVLLGKIRRYVAEHDTGILVCFMAQICLLTGLALTGKKTEMISCERIDPHYVHRAAVYEKILNRIYAASKYTVFQNTTERDYFPENIRKNSVIIPNPVQVQCTAAQSQKKIVAVGRLTDQKNHKMLIRAFQSVKAEDEAYSLSIYGDGPLEEELRTLAESLGLKDCVIFHGNVPDVHEQIKDASMFVLPSNFEGLSNALLEAMMMGLPCISTDCAGAGDAIVDGQNGILIPVGNEQALAEAMLRLIRDEALCQRLGENARRCAEERYSVNEVVSQWIRIFEN